MGKKEIRICFKCENFSKGGFGLCYASENGVSPVNGEIQPLLAISARSDHRRISGMSNVGCGPEGRYFKPLRDVQKSSFLQKLTNFFNTKVM